MLRDFVDDRPKAKARSGVLGLALLLASACGGGAAPPAAPAPEPASEGPPSTAGAEEVPASAVEAEPAGPDTRPVLLVRNDFPAEQHIFVDGAEVGVVASGETATFPIEPGARQVVSADSGDPADNPVAQELRAEVGFRYSWRVYLPVNAD